eukprot:COSAG01_NODE_16304_length_1248_cov_1.470844_1_plen_306_part_01
MRRLSVLAARPGVSWAELQSAIAAEPALEEDSEELGDVIVGSTQQRTLMHVLCANPCAGAGAVREAAQLPVLGACLVRADGDGMSAVGLLATHAGLTTALLLELLRCNPAVAGAAIPVGGWWEQPLGGTGGAVVRSKGGRVGAASTSALHWLCGESDVDEHAIASMLGAGRKVRQNRGGSAAAAAAGQQKREALAGAVDGATGRTPLHVLCANRRCTVGALRVLLSAAPHVASLADASGQWPLELLEQAAPDALRAEMVAMLVDAAAPEVEGAGWKDWRLALPPAEQSEWSARPPPLSAEAAAAIQ